MQLLQWCTLEPSRPSGLAAVRFASPVRVQSLRIFPTDARPFAQSPDTVSRTEPPSFFMDVYFNAHPITSPTAKDKPKPTNALVPSTLCYPGGQVDFAVDMGTEFATRFMIVKGEFEVVSMAIYGELVGEPSVHETYEPRPLPSLESPPIPPALDPANSHDPTQLARQLLNLVPDAPPLPLVVRLIFALKPTSDDWDLPGFPYLHPDLDEEIADFNLEKAFALLVRPVSDDAPPEALERFAERVAQCVKYKDKDDNQAYLVAGILCQSASQHPLLATYLLDAINISQVFEQSDLEEDENTLLRLLLACTNADVAKALNTQEFVEMFSDISKNADLEREIRDAAKQLLGRIQGWDVLEDSLSNTRGDFLAAVTVLTEIGTDEPSFGIWLESMITHNDVRSSLADNPVLPLTLPYPLSLLKPSKSTPTTISQDEFVAFLRAYIGVACVLAVYAWTDALPHARCRERILGILRLWQGVNGYREILNHLLLLKQMTYRLECMTDSDPPWQSGIDSERLLSNLAKDPYSFLRPSFVKSILNVGTTTSFITADDRASMRQAAFIAEDGLAGGIDELLHRLVIPPTFGSLRTLRVALAVISKELDEDEARVLDDFWEEGSCSLSTRLGELFAILAEELHGHFGSHTPHTLGQEVVAQLFRAADEMMALFLRLAPSHPLPGRPLRALTSNIADVFACTDAADMVYSESGPACVAAREARQNCIDLMRVFCEPGASLANKKPCAGVVFKELLEYGVRSEDTDPAHHALQVFCLIDYLLPAQDCLEDERLLWIRSVIPTLLPQLWALCRALDTENKAHFIHRLVELDQGEVGVGEWLLTEEFKELRRALSMLQDPSLPEAQRIVTENQIHLTLRLLADLLRGSSAQWCLEWLGSMDEDAHSFAGCLAVLLDLRLSSQPLWDIADEFAKSHKTIEPPLRLWTVLIFWHALQVQNIEPKEFQDRLEQSMAILNAIPTTIVNGEPAAAAGRLLDHLSQNKATVVGESAHAVVGLLEWLSAAFASGDKRPAQLTTVSPERFTSLRTHLIEELAPDWVERLDVACEGLTVHGDSAPPPPPAPARALADSVTLALHDLEALLRQHTPAPATPPRKPLAQDVLGLVTVSPSFLVRTPAATGLTKLYVANDFRQLRQASSRANTSRLPSMHVDDFESASASSPTIDAPPPVPLPQAAVAAAAAGMPFAPVPVPQDALAFMPLGPPFNPM